MAVTEFLRRFVPPPMTTSYRERLRGSIGAFLGLLATGLLTIALLGPDGDSPWLIAPMGASAVLLFGVPASPLAQPWPVVGGNLLAALIGVTVARLIPDPFVAAALAVGFTLAVASLLRCVHPPSGAVALTAVLGGPHVAALGYSFALVPVGLNSLLLTLSAIAYHAVTRRSYPHVAHSPAHQHPPAIPLAIVPADIDDVLADYGETIDIRRDDLEALFQELVGRAQARAVQAGGR